MKNLLFNFLAVIFISSAIQAQGGGSSASSNSGGEEIRDAANGYSFTVPANWSVKETETGYALTNADKTAGMIIKAHNYKDFESFVAAEVNLEREGYKQAGDIINLGSGGKAVRVYKPNGNKFIIIDAFFLLSTYQGGVIILSVTENLTAAENILPTAAQVVKSVKYSRPQQTEQGSQTQTFFAGKRLYAESGSSQTEIILCSSGAYVKSSNFFFSGGTSTSVEKGAWKAQTSNGASYLILVSNAGQQTNYQASPGQSNGSVNLNGRRYSIQQTNQCR